MNTKIYKQVHSLAKVLLQASQNKDQKKFDKSYAQLQKICEDHEDSPKDHPVQWETLADFTEDLTLAITFYDKALAKAEAIQANDFCASIGYSLATLKIELGDKPAAIENLEKAKINCVNSEDKLLKSDVHDLLYKLKKTE